MAQSIQISRIPFERVNSSGKLQRFPLGDIRVGERVVAHQNTGLEFLKPYLSELNGTKNVQRAQT